MEKAVLISIAPQWCERITRGEKTVEIRKTMPKLETPFRCFIYCTNNGGTVRTSLRPYCKNVDGSIVYKQEIMNGKIIGEFTCDYIRPLFGVCTNDWQCLVGSSHEWEKEVVKRACLSEVKLKEYAKGKFCYAWHISNLKIYDQPKELDQFACSSSAFENKNDGRIGLTGMKRPPQSWCYCYIEEKYLKYV